MNEQNPLPQAVEMKSPQAPVSSTAGRDLRVPIIVGGTVVVVAVTAGGFVLVNQNSQQSSSTSSTTSSVSVTSQGEDAILEALNYEDGTYYAEVGYFITAADKTDYLGVTVTITNGKISALNFEKLDEAGEVVASTYTEEFEVKVNNILKDSTVKEAYQAELVVGSTLTSKAFKEALTKLKVKETNITDEAGTR